MPCDYFVDVSGSMTDSQLSDAAEYVLPRLLEGDRVFACGVVTTEMEGAGRDDLLKRLKSEERGGFDLQTSAPYVGGGRTAYLVTDSHTVTTPEDYGWGTFIVVRVPLCPVCRESCGEELADHARSVGDGRHAVLEVMLA